MTIMFTPSTEFRVNTQTSWVNGNSTITGLANGGFVVSWEQDDCIKLQIYDPNANRVGGELLVTPPPSPPEWINQSGPRIAGLSDGNFVVSWVVRDYDFLIDAGGSIIVSSITISSVAIKAQIFDANGSEVGGEISASVPTTTNQVAPEISEIPGGGFAISWWQPSTFENGIQYTNIKVQIFDVDGNKIGSEVLVDRVDGGGNNCYTRVTGLNDGGFAVAYWDAQSFDIFVQIFDSNQLKSSEKITVNQFTSGSQCLTRN